MSQTATVALSLFCAVAVSVGGVLFSGSRRPEPEAAVPTTDPALRSVLEKLEQRLLGLEQRQSTAASAIGRSEVVVTRAEVEAIVGAAVAKASLAKPVDAASSTEPEFEVGATYRELQSIEWSDRADALWSAARKAGKTKELLALFEAAAKAAPNSSTAQYLHGQACIQALLGTSEVMEQASLSSLADKSFDAALELDETHWEARYSKAIAYSFWPDFLGKKKEAIAHLQTLADQQDRVGPEAKHIETYLTLGNLLAQQGKDAEAKAAWQRGLDRFPSDERLRQALAR